MLKGLGGRLVEKENGVIRQLHGGFCKRPELPASQEGGREGPLCQGLILSFSSPSYLQSLRSTRPLDHHLGLWFPSAAV